MHAAYLDNIVNPDKLRDMVDHIARMVSKEDSIDAIVGRGNSGVSVAACLSYRTGIPLIVVRKEGDGSHSGYRVESLVCFPKRYIIVDDLVASGNTVNKIIDEMNQENPSNSLISVYLYDDCHRPFKMVDGVTYHCAQFVSGQIVSNEWASES